MAAATDEDYRRIYGDQARVMGMRGLLEEEELAVPQYADVTGRTAADFGQVRRPPNWALRSVPGYMGGRTGPPIYGEEMTPEAELEAALAAEVPQVAGPLEDPSGYQALVDSIQASEVIQPDSAIYGDSQALGTVEEARTVVDGAVEQIIPQAVQPEQIAPQVGTGVAAQQQRLIDESTQRYQQLEPLQQPVLPQRPIPGPSLLEQPELSWSDIAGDQAEAAPPLTSEDIFGDVQPDPSVETDILESQARGYIDPDTGLPPVKRPKGVPALKDETAEQRRIRIRREVTGLDLSDMDTRILDVMGEPIGKVAKTVDKMYQMQKQSAMMALFEGMKKKATARSLRGVGRRRQGRQMQLLNPTPLQMEG
jgi:hypothetical protein